MVNNKENFLVADLIKFIQNRRKIDEIKENMKKLSEGFESPNPVDYLAA